MQIAYIPRTQNEESYNFNCTSKQILKNKNIQLLISKNPKKGHCRLGHSTIDFFLSFFIFLATLKSQAHALSITHLHPLLAEQQIGTMLVVHWRRSSCLLFQVQPKNEEITSNHAQTLTNVNKSPHSKLIEHPNADILTTNMDWKLENSLRLRSTWQQVHKFEEKRSYKLSQLGYKFHEHIQTHMHIVYVPSHPGELSKHFSHFTRKNTLTSFNVYKREPTCFPFAFTFSPTII